MFSRRLSSSSRRSSSSTRATKSVEKRFKSTKNVFSRELFQFGTTSPVSSIAKLLLRAATADKIAPAHLSSQSAPNTPLNRCAPVLAWDAPMTPITTSHDVTDYILASPLKKTSHVNCSNDKDNEDEMASKFSDFTKLSPEMPGPLLQTKKNVDSEFSTSSESRKVRSPVEKTKESNAENTQETLEGAKVTDSGLKSMLSAPTNNLTTRTKNEITNSGSFAQSAQKTLVIPEISQKPSQISPAKNEELAKAEERMKAYLEAKQAKSQISKSMDVQNLEKSLAPEDELINVEPPSHPKPETPEKKAADPEAQKPKQVSPAKNEELAKAGERMKAYLEAKQAKILVSKSMDVRNSEKTLAPKEELIDVEPFSQSKTGSTNSNITDARILEKSLAPEPKTPEKKTADPEVLKSKPISPAKNEELAKAEERMKAYLEAKQAKSPFSTTTDNENSKMSLALKEELIDVKPCSQPKTESPEKKDTKQLESPISPITEIENSERSPAPKDQLIDVKHSSHPKTESPEKKEPEDMHVLTKSLVPKSETPEKKPNVHEAQEPQQISPAKVNELAEAENRMDGFLAKDVIPSTPIMRNTEEKFVFSPLKEKSKDHKNYKLTTSKDISPKQCTPYKNRMVHLTSLFSPEKDLNALNDYMENKTQFGPTMNKLMGEIDTDTTKTQASPPEEPIENPSNPLEPKNLKPSDEKWLLKGLAMVFGGKTTSSESTTSSELASESTTSSELSSELLTTSSEFETTSSENTVLSVFICPDELRNALSETENRKDQDTCYTSEHLRIASSSPVKSCFPNSDLLEKVPEWLPHAETPCPSPFGQNFKKSMRPSLPKYSSKDRARSLPINLPFPQPKKKIVRFSEELICKEKTFDEVVNSGGSGFRILSIVDMNTNTITFPKYVPPQ